MSKQKFRVEAKWDAEAELWVATSQDVPGLVIQGHTEEELAEKLRLVIPALHEIGVEREDQIEIRFLARKSKSAARKVIIPLAA